MYIAYFDETGDDGYPDYSSKVFVLTSCYIDHNKWKHAYFLLSKLKKQLKNTYGLPIKTEIHTRKLLLNKNPYRSLNLTNEKRLEFCLCVAEFIKSLDIKCINIVIDKTKINDKNKNTYKDILDISLKFNIQRIENDLSRINTENKFLIITDEGRIKKMRQITRKIQKFNYVPSLYTKSNYRNEIKRLIEDPLPKNSGESYFIQIADFISYFINLYILKTNNIDSWHNRLDWLDIKDVVRVIDKIKPILNMEASKKGSYGIVIYPK